MVKHFYKWFKFYIITLSLSCFVNKEAQCVKSYMNNHKFTYSVDGNLTTNYFIFRDSLQLEYVDNKLYSESIVVWYSCTEYFLRVKKIYYSEKGLQPGDTLKIKVNYFNNDTVFCSATAFDRTFEFAVIREN